nr:MAG TPA: terminase large subunit [Caudoviricetes sp.]
MGSAGSGKSYFITQKLIIRAIQEPIRILVCRKYATTIRQTVFSLFCDVIRRWKLDKFVKINQSDYRIIFLHNKSEIIFTGLDEETKLLSLNNIGSVFIEEVFEVEQELVEQLNLRMRGKTKNQQIIMAWNPISQDSWLYDFTVTNPPKSSVFIHSTYKDNPFLSLDYIESLEELQFRNPQKWRIYGLGQWGINTDGLVFRNWRKDKFDVQELAKKGWQLRVGMDLGFVDPSTIVSSMYNEETSTIYVFDAWSESGCQLDEIKRALEQREWINRHTKIYMDSADARAIDYFRRQGYNAVQCLKGPGSVESRITFLQNHEIIVDEVSGQKLVTELSNFSYIKDKKTGKYTEKTTHEYSHCIDGLGYAYSDIYTKGRVRTFDRTFRL